MCLLLQETGKFDGQSAAMMYESIEKILDRQDIPDDAKDEIKCSIAKLKSQQFISQQIADFESEISLLDRTKITQGAVEFFRERFELQRVSIALLDKEKKGFHVYAMTTSDSSGIVPGSFIPFEETYLSEVITGAEPQYRPDIQILAKDQNYAMDKKLIAANVRSTFYVPLRYEGSPIGILNVCSNLIDAFSEDFRDILVLLSNRLALALQNALLHDQLRRETKALRENEEKYRTILDNIEEGVYEVDLRGNFTFVNENISEILGYSREEITKMNYRDYSDEETAASVFRAFNQVYSTKIPKHAFNWEIIRKDKTRRYIEASISLITNSKGEPTGFRGVARDIHKRKQVEIELQESEQRFRTLVNTMTEGLWLTDLQNKFFKTITNEQLVKRIPSSTYELKWYKKDTSVLITRVAGTALYNQQKELIGSFGALSDITAEKQAQEALQKSEERYRRLIELSPDAITLTDLEFTIIAANQQSVLQNGVDSAEELIGRNALDMIFPEDRQRAMENAQTALNSGRIIQTEYRLQRKDKTYFPAELKAALIDDEKGNATGFIAVTRDITDRKRVENALRERALLIEKMAEGVVLEDEKGFTTFANPRAIEMLGYSEEELLGKHWSVLVSDEYRAKAFAETAKRPAGISSTYELTIRTKDGRHISVIMTASPLFTDDGEFKGVMDVFTDITDRKRVEKALLQAKLEEERYHAMLSHFVNNDLQKIINYTDLIALNNESGKDLETTNIQKIINIATRSSKTIDRVNKIFEVLQFPFIQPLESTPILDVIEAAVNDVSVPLHYIDIDHESLNLKIYCDQYLKQVFSELLEFLLSACDDKSLKDLPILIEGSEFSSYFRISVLDKCSQPISEDISTRLSGTITEEWEAQGHYVGIAFASQCMRHFEGKLKISTSQPRGNKFELMFPKTLIRSQQT
ncbi:MAG: PAS domain S-box protein [Candidatus Hodarchaeales archaeon]